MSNKLSEVILLTKSRYANELECWLNWHLNIVKFDHVMLFDNDSPIDVDSIINKFPGKITCTHVHGWPNQYKLYNDYLENTEYKWSITLDDDEYLYISDRYGGAIEGLINDLNSSHPSNKYYIMWVNMLSKEAMQTHTGLFLNTHIYYSYSALNIRIPFSRNNLGKCLHNNSIKYKYYYGSNRGHIPECDDKNDKTVLVNTGEEINSEVVNCEKPYTDCFIAHYQLKNRDDWMKKAFGANAGVYGFKLTFLKPVYDEVYKHHRSFIKCSLLKDRYENYLSENS